MTPRTIYIDKHMMVDKDSYPAGELQFVQGMFRHIMAGVLKHEMTHELVKELCAMHHCEVKWQ